MSDRQSLTPAEAQARLAGLPGWEIDADGTVLRRTYRLAHLPAAILALHIARIQDELDHHSDMTVGYDSLKLELTTHSAGSRLTPQDFALADRVSVAAAAHGAD